MRFGTKLVVDDRAAARRRLLRLGRDRRVDRPGYATIAGADGALRDRAWASRARRRPRRSWASCRAAKAGVGSAVNDATRLLGGTLGVAVIGSVYASLYSSRLTADAAGAPAARPRRTRPTTPSAPRWPSPHGLRAAGHAPLAAGVHARRPAAFMDGLSAGCLVAGGVAAVGAVMAALLLPAFPSEPAGDADTVQSPIGDCAPAAIAE